MKVKSYPAVILCLLILFLPFPLFSQDSHDNDIVINEIMYNPSSVQGDDNDCEWLELYNTGNFPVDLGGWLLDGVSFGEPVIEAGERIVVARELIDGPDSDSFSFEAFWGSGNGVWGDTEIENFRVYEASISLKNSQDSIVLESPAGYQDIVSYSSSLGANGNGRTLERNPGNLEEWNESYEESGTPGRINNRAPNSPINLTVEGEETITLTWQEAVDPDGHPIDYYLIELFKTDSPIPIIDEKVGGPSYQLSGLEAGEYFFHIAASDGYLLGSFSESFNFSISTPVYSDKLVITELFPDPVSPLKDSDDEAIELYNSGGEEINLSGWILRDTQGLVKEHLIGDLAISPDQYLVFYSKDTKISLNNDGDSVELLNPKKEIVSSTAIFGKASPGLSFALMDNGEWLWTSSTLGAKNLYPSGGAPAGKVLASSQSSQTKMAGSEKNSIEVKEPLTSYTPVVLGADSRRKNLAVSNASPVQPKVYSTSSDQTVWWLIIALSSAGLLFILFYPWQKKENLL